MRVFLYRKYEQRVVIHWLRLLDRPHVHEEHWFLMDMSDG